VLNLLTEPGGAILAPTVLAPVDGRGEPPRFRQHAQARWAWYQPCDEAFRILLRELQNRQDPRLDQLRNDLLVPGGVVNPGVTFPKGGPGANPLDVSALIRGPGWQGNAVSIWKATATRYHQTLRLWWPREPGDIRESGTGHSASNPNIQYSRNTAV
jgi:hypothetical protein